jgi:hypothetical protein
MTDTIGDRDAALAEVAPSPSPATDLLVTTCR